MSRTDHLILWTPCGGALVSSALISLDLLLLVPCAIATIVWTIFVLAYAFLSEPKEGARDFAILSASGGLFLGLLVFLAAEFAGLGDYVRLALNYSQYQHEIAAGSDGAAKSHRLDDWAVSPFGGVDRFLLYDPLDKVASQAGDYYEQGWDFHYWRVVGHLIGHYYVVTDAPLR